MLRFICKAGISVGAYGLKICHIDCLLVALGKNGLSFLLDKLSEVTGSPRLGAKMKVSLSNKRRLVAELEALGESEGAAKCLEHMRVIVGRDAVSLGELEALLKRAQVEAALKTEVTGSPRHGAKMKYVFGRSRYEDESLGSLMRSLCSVLRVSLSNKRRLVAELEALGESEGAAKCLEHMRVIVGRDAVTLGELEALLERAQVEAALKTGFMAEMEVYE
nr:hypothetical protein [Tanacetum cinerariifolium]